MLYKLWWAGLVALLSAALSLGLPPGTHLGEPEESNATQEQEGGGFIDPNGLTIGGTAPGR